MTAVRQLSKTGRWLLQSLNDFNALMHRADKAWDSDPTRCTGNKEQWEYESAQSGHKVNCSKNRTTDVGTSYKLLKPSPQWLLILHLKTLLGFPSFLPDTAVNCFYLRSQLQNNPWLDEPERPQLQNVLQTRWQLEDRVFKFRNIFTSLTAEEQKPRQARLLFN